MSEPTNEAKQRKDRSPNFPFITLEKALERIKAFYDRERRNAAFVPVVAKYWGYGEKSSGGIQTVAALKSYGLIEDTGKGPERKIRLSDLALQILLPRPDSLERANAITQATLTPKQMSSVKEKWPDHPPSDDSLRWHLVREKEFTEEAAADFTKIWNANKEFARLYTSEIQDVIKDRTEESIDAMPEIAQTVPSALRDSQVRAALVKSEKVIGPDGDILLQFSGGEPSLDTYEFLKAYIELRLQTLSRKARKVEEAEEKN